MAEVKARTLWQLIEERASQSPDALMSIDEGDHEVTFGEYRAAVERAAAGLAGLGVGEGTPVSWQLPTWSSSLVLVGALSRLGAVQNPILPIYRDREVRFVTRQTGARLFIVPPVFRNFDFQAMAEGIAGDSEGMDVLVSDHSLPEGDPATLPAPPEAATEPQIRWVFYTSGTTADPKGARHTDHTIWAASHAMNLGLDLRAEDRSALAFPFTHIGGINWLFSSLMTGASLILVETFDPVATVEVLRRQGCTVAGSGTPFHMAYLAAQRATLDEKVLPDVRVFPGGGAPKPPQLHYDVQAEVGGVGIVSGYGLTECPILSMGSIDDSPELLATTEGSLSPGIDARVVTIEGKPAGTNEEGELRVKGPQLFKGYLDTTLDADAFDDDGYFRTGDLGRIDAGGYVVITGRLKDVIIRKGENISAKEVEDLLYTHPKVADVAVIGLPDPALGEKCCAVVASKDPADPLTFAEMSAFLKEQGLMIQKVPEQLELVDTVPRNPAGKILKHQLRERYSSSP